MPQSYFQLSGIYIYPVKSLAGIQVSSWPVVATGLKYDRQWMLIDGNRQFLSQRVMPRMALINTAIQELLLNLSAPGMDDLGLMLMPTGDEIIRSTIWHDHVDTVAVSREADQWFSQFLHTDCRLVYLPQNSIRHVNPDFARHDDRTTLSDGFPFLLTTESSLTALNQAMQFELTMNRFRPNLVISGCDSFAEDTWRDITIGSIGFRLPKPCSRCSVPTINPETGETGKEPLTTLNRLRKWQHKVYFGQNAIHNGGGVLSVGDNVQINLTGRQQPPLT
ncbi:hypothetical protein MCAMS1_01822 [biofilm metagenome]